MADVLTEDFANGVRERFLIDSDGETVHVERTQDVQNAVDHVANINSQGLPSIDGMGIPIVEVPVTVGIAFCEKYGIPWNKFAYTREYDDAFELFIIQHPKLVYAHKQKYFSG
jgi:hypothetical protein